VELRYVGTNTGQTTNHPTGFGGFLKDSPATRGFRLYDLVFPGGALGSRLQLVLGTATLGPHRLLAYGQASLNREPYLKAPGHIVALHGEPPIMSALPDAPLGREIDLAGYYTAVDGQVHRLEVQGTPGGAGKLAFNPNRITFDPFGEPVAFTMMGYQRHEITLKPEEGADPLGQGRRLYWAVSKDPRNTNRVAVVLGQTEIGPHRLLLYRGDQVVFIVPAQLTERLRQEIQMSEIATLSPGEQQAIADLRGATGYRFHCRIEEGQAVELVLTGDKGTVPPGGVLARLPNLRSVDFTGGRFPAAGLADLRRLPHLRYLFFSGAEFGSNGLAMLKDLDQLESLLLQECRGITDDGVQHLAGLTGLTRLSLYNEEIVHRPPDPQRCVTDAGVAHLTRLTRLEHLDLFGQDLSDASVPILIGMTELQELRLSGHGWTDAGLDGLARLPKLSSLRLFETAVTTNGVAALKSRLPELQVEAWSRDTHD
jgi:hypothetical protein